MILHFFRSLMDLEILALSSVDSYFPDQALKSEA